MTTTPTNFDANEPLNAIVARAPHTLEVFRRYGMDTCCGGALPLATAAQHHGLDVRDVIAALQEAAEAGRDR